MERKRPAEAGAFSCEAVSKREDQLTPPLEICNRPTHNLSNRRYFILQSADGHSYNQPI